MIQAADTPNISARLTTPIIKIRVVDTYLINTVSNKCFHNPWLSPKLKNKSEITGQSIITDIITTAKLHKLVFGYDNLNFYQPTLSIIF